MRELDSILHAILRHIADPNHSCCSTEFSTAALHPMVLAMVSPSAFPTVTGDVQAWRSVMLLHERKDRERRHEPEPLATASPPGLICSEDTLADDSQLRLQRNLHSC